MQTMTYNLELVARQQPCHFNFSHQCGSRSTRTPTRFSDCPGIRQLISRHPHQDASTRSIHIDSKASQGVSPSRFLGVANLILGRIRINTKILDTKVLIALQPDGISNTRICSDELPGNYQQPAFGGNH